ncbi:hypothetical protein HY489_03850 [Candidatus Woesearchaeota archaeon]|nr:hypothetical protein [Candidatus Woesearchaeota archaeon]
MSYIENLRQTLSDPQLAGFSCLTPDQFDAVRAAVTRVPPDSYVSEWRTELGQISYKYHIHGTTRGEELRKLLADGKTSRHPQLTAVYTVGEIEAVLDSVNHADSL